MNGKSFLRVIADALVGLPRRFALGTSKGFKPDGMVLYQTDHVLGMRLPGAENLAGYVKRLDEVCATFFTSAHRPESLRTVVVLKPGKQSRVWFISSIRQSGDAELETLRCKLEAVPPPDVALGPVAFAISAKIAGGDGKPPLVGPDFRPPIPKEWRDAAAKGNLPALAIDDLLNLVWPDAAAIPARDFAPASANFVVQVLEPIGGKILRPKDWFYSERHQGTTYRWTLSREDISKSQSYTTGVRIQTFVGVKEISGQSAKDFIFDVVAKKKAQATRVLSTSAAVNQGVFTRTGLETEEGSYHIMYSLFWGNRGLDIAVVSIAGTTKELWATYSPTFERMGSFELIDMDRFES